MSWGRQTVIPSKSLETQAFSVQALGWRLSRVRWLLCYRWLSFSFLSGEPRESPTWVSVCNFWSTCQWFIVPKKFNLIFWHRSWMKRKILELRLWCDWLLKHLVCIQTMPMEKHMEILALALDKLGSHDLGRAALARVAMSQPGITPSVTNEDLLESESSLVADRDSLPWIKLWQNLAAALDSNEILNPVHVGLIRRFALAATVLSDSGQR